MYKPVILLGQGCRNNPALVDHLCSLNIPVLTTWMGLDLVAEDTPAYCGRPGVFGQRAANIIQQKATELLCFGARLDGEQIAYDYERFAPDALKVIYDIDNKELDKFSEVNTFRILDDIRNLTELHFDYEPLDPSWLSWCKGLYRRFRPELDGTTGGTEYVDTFAFMNALSEACHETDLLAVGSSSGAVNSFLQTFRVKAGQRVTVCASIGAMGADIPMSIGGCLASGRRTICITGDGGFQLNTQELEVVHRLNLPITYFVFSNGGYNSIRVMQDARFEGRHVGCNTESGYTMPELRGLAKAYKIPYIHLDPQWIEAAGGIKPLLGDRPGIVEVKVDPNWQQFPRVMASTVNGQLRTDDMQDMTPKLDPAELEAIMRWDG